MKAPTLSVHERLVATRFVGAVLSSHRRRRRARRAARWATLLPLLVLQVKTLLLQSQGTKSG